MSGHLVDVAVGALLVGAVLGFFVGVYTVHRLPRGFRS